MKKLILITMRWPEYDEPVIVGTNKKKLKKEALKILKLEHGSGPVLRPGAMFSAPIQHDDLNIWEIPFLETSKQNKE